MKAWAIAFLALLLFGPGAASGWTSCSSSVGCSDCENDENNIAACKTVLRSESCECSISIANPCICVLKDACDYTGGSGGGTGGGGTGGGGSTCYQLPGGWCPAECSSCTTVFWY
jgi:hypothetical protein